MRIDPRLAASVAALAGLWLGGQGDWWRLAWRSDLTASGVGGITGAAGTGALSVALPAVALAGLLVTLTLKRAGRRAVGVLTALAGAGIAVLGFAPRVPSDEAVEQALRTTLATQWEVATTWQPWAYGATGLLLAAASCWLVARPPTPATNPDQAGNRGELADSQGSWKAMDEGLDPTDTEGERA